MSIFIGGRFSMTEKQNAEMLIKQAIDLLKVAYAGGSYKSKINSAIHRLNDALRAAAPSPRPNAEMLDFANYLAGLLADHEGDIAISIPEKHRDMLVGLLRAAAPSPHPRREPEMLELANEIEQRHGDDHNGNRSYLFTREQRDLIVAALFAAPPPAGADAVSEIGISLANRIHDACPHYLGFDFEEGPIGCNLVSQSFECVCEHVHMHALRLLPAPQPQEKDK